MTPPKRDAAPPPGSETPVPRTRPHGRPSAAPTAAPTATGRGPREPRPPASAEDAEAQRAHGAEQAERAEGEVFRAVADYTYDWESWIDAAGQLVWVNPAVERMTGFGVAECFRMADYPLPLVHPDDRDAIAAQLRSAAAGGSGNDFEFRIVTKQGETRWLAVSWQGLQQGDGVPLGYRTSVRDIHERKLAERRLQEAMRWAEQAAAARQDFLATMSHELRTPLQCIVGYAQLLQEELGNSRQRHFAQTILAEGEAMLRIVGSVLEFSSLQAVESPLEERTFDLAGLVEGCVRAARPLADAKGLSLQTKIVKRGLPQHVTADDLRIRQVLTNLIGNAIKFTDAGRIVVTLTCGAEQAREQGSRRRRGPPPAGTRCIVRLAVKDTGSGIDPAVQSRLFTPFHQADKSAARKHGGTGLGLAISKRLCDLLGGDVRVETEPGRGSTFFVEIPVLAAATPSHDSPLSPAGPALARIETDRLPAADPSPTPPHAERDFAERHPLSILVVDDSPAVLELTTEFLKLLGYTATSAASAREAVTATSRAAYDLILMDLHMPDLDGMTAARLIRAQGAERRARPVIVALTANPFARARALSSDGGMDAFMTKPLVFSDLKLLLTRVAAGEELTGPPGALPEEQPPETELDSRVLDDLRETRGSDGRSLLERLGNRVIEDGAGLLEELESALSGRPSGARLPLERSELVRHVAHRLKGNALLVGATALARECQKLEELAAGGREAARQARVVAEGQGALERALSRLLESL